MRGNTTLNPTDWHRRGDGDGDAEQCSVCGCALKELGAGGRQSHQAVDRDGRGWRRRVACAGGFRVYSILERPSRRPRKPRRIGPRKRTAAQLDIAAEIFNACGSIPQTARRIGIPVHSLRAAVKRHAEYWEAALERARRRDTCVDPGATLLCLARPPAEDLQAKIRRATALRAAGYMWQEAADELGVSYEGMLDWRRQYPHFWQQELDRGMEASLIVVRRQAGTDAVTEDPEKYIRQALVCERWTTAAGREIFSTDGRTTLTSFFEDYYLPTRLSDARPATVLQYRETLGRWKLLTGDPPLEEISVKLLTVFRDCLQKLRGRQPHLRMSSQTVRKHLRHLQAVLGKAGPPGRGNRDAAGELDRVAWIRPPRYQPGEPRFVTADELQAVYLAAVCLDRPKIDGFKPAAWWRALIVVGYNTGLRKGTLLSMPMASIDWKQRLIDLQPSVMKNRRRHVVPLNETAHRHLLQIRTGRELVFEFPQSMRLFYHDWHQLQDAAGIPRAKHFGLQNLRDTAATLLWERDPAAAQLMLGHASRSTTRDCYVASRGILAKAAEALPQPGAFAESQSTNDE